MHPSHHHQQQQKQQLQPLGGGGGGGSNSAQSSPLKRVPPPAVSPLASPMESRRLQFLPSASSAAVDHPHQQQHHMLSALQLGYTIAAPAQPAKLLIDPQTGQQYFVPTAPHQPMPYFAAAAQPLFYNQPAPAFFSTPATAPVQSHPSGFLFTAANHPHQPPTTLWSAAHNPALPSALAVSASASSRHQRAQSPSASSAIGGGTGPSSSSPFQHQQQQSYRVEIPPSSVDSVCEEEANIREQLQQQHFQRQHRSRLSAESYGSTRSSTCLGGQHHASQQQKQQEMMYNTGDDSFGGGRSPPPSTRQLNFAHSQPHSSHQQFTRQLLLQPDHHSTGGSSSESTSGFASGRDRLRNGDALSNGRSPPQSPMMLEQRMRFPSVGREETVEDGSQRHRWTESPRSPPPEQAPQRMKAIRMDIDLNRPNSPPEQGQVSVRATVLRTAPPTAFTISFNDTSPKTVTDCCPSTDVASPMVSISGVQELSLQEAARQAPTGRRLMARRSVPPRPPLTDRGGTDSGSETGGDPKRWLFRKMMMGRRDQHHQQKDKQHLNEDGEEGRGGEADDKEDQASEAGTYVVEGKKMSQSQLTVSVASPTANQSGSSPSSGSSTSSSSARSPTPTGDANPKRSLMTDLRRLREMKQQTFVTPAPKVLPPKAPIPQRKGPQHQQNQQQQIRPCRQLSSANATTPLDSPFSRNDGGRFSMRPVRPATQQHQQQQRKEKQQPTTKTGQSQGKSAEMIAWLRRKEYDPRKAATEQRSTTTTNNTGGLKQQEAFMANRSLSTSATAKSPFARWRHNRNTAAPMGDPRINRSHDDLSRLGESMDEESLIGGAVDSCSSSLQRTVDELTQKCHKSIALLKLCNQSGLSSSVEQLLERVVDGKTGGADKVDASMGNKSGENISDRLETLSSAFDAIQKYLEEQTTMSSSRGSLAALTGTKVGSPSGSRKMDGKGEK